VSICNLNAVAYINSWLLLQNTVCNFGIYAMKLLGNLTSFSFAYELRFGRHMYRITHDFVHLR